MTHSMTGTQRTFKLREVIPMKEVDARKARTFNVPLPHNSVGGYGLMKLPADFNHFQACHHACILPREIQTLHPSPTHT